MKYQESAVRFILVCGFAYLLVACTATATVGNLVMDVPDGWHIQKENPNSFVFSPKDDMGLPVLTVQTCERTQLECSTPCETGKIRENFFYFATNSQQYEFEDKQLIDGSVEYRVSGIILGQGDAVQLASTVICSNSEIIFISLMAMDTKQWVKNELEKVISNIRRRR